MRCPDVAGAWVRGGCFTTNVMVEQESMGTEKRSADTEHVVVIGGWILYIYIYISCMCVPAHTVSRQLPTKDRVHEPVLGLFHQSVIYVSIYLLT